MTTQDEIIAMLIKQNDERYQDLKEVNNKLFELVNGHADMSAQLMSFLIPDTTQSVSKVP